MNKRQEPIAAPNLGSNPAYKEPMKKQGISKNVQFQKYSSEQLHETKVKYQENVMPIPNLNKNGNNREMPKEQYTKEERLQRPIENQNKRLNIVGKQKEELSFSKGTVNPIGQKIAIENEIPLDVNKNIEAKEESSSMEIPPLKGKKKRPWIPILVLGIELVILLMAMYYKNEKEKTTLECTNETYNEYYHAKIMNTKKYAFKKGIITKLEDTIVYIFDTEEDYTTFKEINANPEKDILNGRKFVSTVDDNQKKYTEITTYDFNQLRKHNETDEEHTILINSKNEKDTIQLLDYNSTDIKLIYESEYVCK